MRLGAIHFSMNYFTLAVFLTPMTQRSLCDHLYLHRPTWDFAAITRLYRFTSVFAPITRIEALTEIRASNG